MNDALAVQHDLYALERHVEQPARFDALQPLVEERGAVDGDLLAHLPVRVAQRLLRRHPLQLLRWRVAEGPSGSGEDDALDGARALAPQALPDGGVLAVV